MKPNFALLLSSQKIRLFHRSFPFWHSVGEADPEDPELSDALKALRERARHLERAEMRTKIILPEDQVRYLSFDIGTHSGENLARLVQDSLEGATPYTLDDLAYDWTVGGTTAYIAAVARKTLREAENFAARHGFAPVCFVAMPEQTSFIGEPFFGPTELAASLLPEDETPVRDTAPLQIRPRTLTRAAAVGSAATSAVPAEAPPKTATAPEIAPAEPASRALVPVPTAAVTPPLSRSARWVGAGVAAALLIAGLGWAGWTYLRPAPQDPDVTVTSASGASSSAPDISAEPQAEPDQTASAPWPDTIWRPQDIAAPQATIPPQTDAGTEDLYLASVDPAITHSDAIALPGALPETDARPPRISSPANATTTFTRDERGVVVATPEGSLTPDGIRVIAGRPPVTPPVRPKVSEAPPPAPAADPRLAASRPKIRPEGLIETNERAELGGFSRAELAALRPQLRPASLQKIATPVPDTAIKAPEPEQAAETVIQPPAPQIPTATAQAVSRSLKPKTRPRDIAKVVRQARSAQPASAAETGSQSANVRVRSNETVRPSAPTPRHVARQATDENVLKFSRVNLIGVFGSPRNRKALVLLANGQYVKVGVGDGLDGGSVSAIGDGELRYVKRGKTVVLKMPKG